MSRNNAFFLKKPSAGKTSFQREITVALVLKFLLLAGLWWLFFAGNKQPVNEAIIAYKILGEHRPLTHSRNTQEHP